MQRLNDLFDRYLSGEHHIGDKIVSEVSKVGEGFVPLARSKHELDAGIDDRRLSSHDLHLIQRKRFRKAITSHKSPVRRWLLR